MGSFTARRPEIRAECVRRKTRPSSPTLRVALVRMLRTRLTKDTAFFALPDDEARMQENANPFGQGVLAGAPALVFIHGGRAFGLALKTGPGALSDAQRTAQLTLRAAGMRVEVARDLREALAHLRDMGIPLESDAGAAFHPWARDGERGR